MVSIRRPDLYLWSNFGEFMVCPHCGADDEETTDYPSVLEHDGDKTKVECHNCGQIFEATMSVEYSYATRIPRDVNP
jgi:uncharacterized Zn finger protein